MQVKNNEELENWLFDHAQIQGHICDGIKDTVNGETVNVAYTDRNSGEKFEFEYEA